LSYTSHMFYVINLEHEYASNDHCNGRRHHNVLRLTTRYVLDNYDDVSCSASRTATGSAILHP